MSLLSPWQRVGARPSAHTTPLAPAERRAANTTLHVAGAAGTFLAAGMFVSAAVAWGYNDPDQADLIWAGVAVGLVSLVMWRSTRPVAGLSRMSAFTVVGFAWIYIFFAGTVPYVLAGTFDSYLNALFETVSGLTTTGSTVLPNIEEQGRGLLLYRQYTQWFGGGGIVLLAVAILQGFGVGGLELAGAEIAGPTTERIAPRMAATARRLWTVYGSLTLAVFIGLLIVGARPFDAVAHAMTSVSTAGFSTFDNSIAGFDSAAVESVLILGMLAGATSFALQYRAYTQGPRPLLQSREFRTYIGIFAAGVVVVVLINIGDGMNAATALRDGAFSVTTTLTGTGYTTADFTRWLPGAQLLLLVFMVMGGMTGSTTGALKQLRVRLLLSFVWRDVRRTRQPRGVYPIRLGTAVVPEDTVNRVVAFVSLYVATILGGTILLTVFGEDGVTALSGVISDLGLVGPGLGDAGPTSNFLVFSDPSRAVLIVLMFVGRMELYVALLMFVAPANAVRRAAREHRRSRAASTFVSAPPTPPPAAVGAVPPGNPRSGRED